MLRLDKSQAETYSKVVDTALTFFPFVDKKTVLRMGLDLGLVLAEKSLELTEQDKAVHIFLTEDPRNSIRLLFPNLDFSYAYPETLADESHHQHFMRANFDID